MFTDAKFVWFKNVIVELRVLTFHVMFVWLSYEVFVLQRIVCNIHADNRLHTLFEPLLSRLSMSSSPALKDEVSHLCKVKRRCSLCPVRIVVAQWLSARSSLVGSHVGISRERSDKFSLSEE